MDDAHEVEMRKALEMMNLDRLNHLISVKELRRRRRRRNPDHPRPPLHVDEDDDEAKYHMHYHKFEKF